jgi:hypothetical protein
MVKRIVKIEDRDEGKINICLGLGARSFIK